MRHRLIAFPVALLATLAVATTVVAGGWAQVTVTDPPVDPAAGGGTSIELNVHQHGVTPVSWPHLTVIATDAASGAVVRSDALAKGPEGTYVSTIVFPTAGDWTLTFESPELEMAGTVAVSVAPGVIAAPPAVPVQPARPAEPVVVSQPAESTSAGSAFDPMPLMLLILAAGVATIGALLLVRGGAASGGAKVPARN